MLHTRALGLLLVGCLCAACEEAPPDDPAAQSGSSSDDGEAMESSATGEATDETSGGMQQSDCFFEPICEADEYCADDGTCVERAPVGGACTYESHCRDGLACIMDVCSEPLPAGEPCEDESHCQGVCLDGVCWDECSRFRCDEGEPCCDAGEYCHDIAGTPGHCRPQAGEGEACDSRIEAACDEGLYCAVTTCSPRLPQGANCDYTDHWPECEEGLECDLRVVPPTCEPA